MHNLAGVLAHQSQLELGQTAVLSTRTLGIWLLFACRVTALVDEPTQFGFTYATLPDHPEQGEETFMLFLRDGTVDFSITANSRPGTTISRLAGPIGQLLQKRYTDRYLSAMKLCVTR